MDAVPSPMPPLRQRWQGYLRAFGLGLAAATLIGLIVWWATSVRLADAVGYTYSVLGALLLLVGGMRGSGYAFRAGGGEMPGAGARRRPPAARGEAGGDTKSPAADPLERRRRRLSVGPDPTSFWQVVAGSVYLGLGVVITLVFATSGG